MFFDFFLIVLVVKFLVTRTIDATLSHLGIVVDVGIGETSPFHKENLHAQQQYCQTHNRQCQ